MKRKDLNILGEFYTPLEAANLLAKITKSGVALPQTVYDPTCGTGMLLLSFSQYNGIENNHFYGQEINHVACNSCIDSMMLSGIKNFDIACGDVLLNPKHLNIKFDVIVANPPYSMKFDRDKLKDDQRFSQGLLPPQNNADYAFILHILHSLKEDGIAAIVMSNGALYRGAASKDELNIRKFLIENNYIDTVITLPENIFLDTAIPTCIIVMRKRRNNNKILFIDATKEFVAMPNKNKLSNQEKILDTFVERKSQKHFSEEVDITSIPASNYYSLMPNHYIDYTPQELSFFESNLQVKYVELGELGKLYYGLSHRPKPDINGNALLITRDNVVSNSTVDASSAIKVRVLDTTKSEVKYGDIIFSCSNKTLTKFGFSSVLTTKSTIPFIITHSCWGFRLHDNNILLPEFSKYLFREQFFRVQLLHGAVGVIRFVIPKNLFYKIKIPVPSLEVQQRIVDYYDNIK